MATAKKPQDHKPPQAPAKASAKLDVQPEEIDPVDAAASDTQQYLEFNGQRYKINYEAINDIEVLEAFQRYDSLLPADVNGAIVALQKSLGSEYHRLKADYKANHNGVMPATAIIELFYSVNGRASGN